MDNNTIFSKTGKGVLEIKNKAGKLPKDLLKVLTLIDGKSTVADLLVKAKLNDAKLFSFIVFSIIGYLYYYNF